MLRDEWESLTVTDGARDFYVLMLPAIVKDDLNWDARQTVRWIWEHEGDKVDTI